MCVCARGHKSKIRAVSTQNNQEQPEHKISLQLKGRKFSIQELPHSKKCEYQFKIHIYIKM